LAISVEKIGKTIEEAKLAALAELQVPEDRVTVEILEDRTRGFLGLSGRQVRIRVTVLEERATATPNSTSETEPAPIMSPDVAQTAQDLLSEILRAMKLDLSVARRDEPDRVVLEMSGTDAGILTSQRGQALDALQYLLTYMVSRKVHGKVRLMLDAEGYRSRREQSLRRLALELARQVRDSGQEAVMDALSPAERRVVHLALANEPGVTTYSEGEDPNRRVVISPVE
jgi:spoIIIJ-associated protein